jgi:hypothetical protein
MAQKVTEKAISRIITKGLTGWEAGKLLLQDFINEYYGKDSILTESDITSIQNMSIQGNDVKDYNMFMALCRGFYKGCMFAEWTCTDACLRVSFIDQILDEAIKRRTIELFESAGPHIVTRKQYEDIVEAQRQKKLEFEYNLGYAIEQRFYAIAPDGVRNEIDGLGIDIESAEDFATAVNDKYADLYKQAKSEIHKLYFEGRLNAVYHNEDVKIVEPLLIGWKNRTLSDKDIMKLIDLLFVTGQQLYNCKELPEWKDYMNKYHEYLFGDEDKQFCYSYAIIEDCPECWMDGRGLYKNLPKASEYITRDTERVLGLIDLNDKPKRSINIIRDELKKRLEEAEQIIRQFLAIKIILDTVAEAIELYVPVSDGILADQYKRLNAFVNVYNFRLERVCEKKYSWESEETKLEKLLKMLPAIDIEKHKPSSESFKKLKNEILKDAHGEDWLHTKVLSLEYEDGFGFKNLIREG